MNEIQAMRVYVRVVEAGTFTRAADSLGVLKSNVSKHIQALEVRLQAKLLNRTTRRVTVTADGAAYYDRAARLLNDFDDIEASMTNARAHPSGKLRLDIGSSIAKKVIVPALSGFCERYPDVQIDLGVSDVRVDLISDNVDCVIRSGELMGPSLVARRIGDMSWMTVASPGYLKRYGVPGHPSEIPLRHLLVGFFAGHMRRLYPHEFHRNGEVVEITEPYRLSLNDRTAHMAAVLGGFGLSQVPSCMAEPLIESGELVRILPDWTRPPLALHAVYPSNRHLSAKVRAFVDWAAELFSAHPQLRRS